VRPKLLRPLELKRLPLPDPDAAGPAPQAVALAAGWARLEARQAAWKEEQEAREIELLEREMSLHKTREALEAEQETLDQRRHTLALDQARNLAELERHSEGTQGPHGTSTRQFYLSGTAPRCRPPDGEVLDGEPPADESIVDDDEDDEACDEMWDTDWTTVSPHKESMKASPAPSLPELRLKDADGGLHAAGGVGRQPSGGTGESSSPGGAESAGSTGQCCEPMSAGQASASGAPSGGAASRATSRTASPPALDPAEREVFQQRLEEKRRLAELHNGEDLSLSSRSESVKSRMPGVHPDIAQKLEERYTAAPTAEGG